MDRCKWENTKLALQDLQEVLKCQICKKIPISPINYNMCGHSFCQTCVKGKKNACPSCGIPTLVSEITTDRLITNLVTGFQKIADTIGLESVASSVNNEIVDEDEPPVKESNTNTVPENLNKKEKRTSTRSSNKVVVKIDNLKTEETKKKPRNSRGKQKLEVTDIGKPPTIKEARKSATRNSTSKGINKRNAKGETQLHAACIKGKVDQVKNFLENGANPNTKDHAGWTPLLEAVNNGFIEIVQLLLKYGAMVNVPGYENITPLHEAVSNGRLDIIKLLMKYGANAQVRNMSGITPRDLAQTGEVKAALNSTQNILKPIVEFKPTNLDPENVGFLSCLLDKEQQKQLSSLSQKLKLKVLSSFSSEVTHIVVATDSRNVCAADKNIIQGILQGRWIVNCSWLAVCLETKTLVDPEPFEVEGTSRHPSSQAPRRGRINAEKQFPSIFNGCHIFLAGLSNIFTYEDLRLSKSDMTALICSGDGIILSREPDPEGIPSKECTVPYHAVLDGPLARCSHYIIYSTGKDEPKLKYNMTHTKSLPLQWLFDCMESFTLKNP